MTILAGNILTLLDHAKRTDPNGKAAKIVELLAQTNDVIRDMLFKEGNLVTGHRTTVRVGLPLVFWRLLNQGIPPSKSKTAQIDEAIGMLEAFSEIDVEVANLNGDVAATRLSEASAFLEAMAQEHASTLFYGNSSVSPEEFNGFAVRYSDLSAVNAQNILDAGGTSNDNLSIWLISWGGETITGIYPKGSKAGMEHLDLGKQVVEVSGGIAGTKLLVYLDNWKMKLGLAVKDWRFAVRICNVDVSDLGTGSEADISVFMTKAIHRLPSLNMGKNSFYMNRTALEALDLQRRKNVSDGGQLSYDVVDGKNIPFFRGIPIGKVDALINAEARVV